MFLLFIIIVLFFYLLIHMKNILDKVFFAITKIFQHGEMSHYSATVVFVYDALHLNLLSYLLFTI